MSSGSNHKLYNYEVTPPASAWKKIAEALDEADLEKEYPSRLYGAEVVPPAAVWNKIVSVLDAEDSITKPAPRKINPIVRYAAAAAVIAFVILGGLRLFNNKSSKNGSGDEVVIGTNVPPVKTTIDQPVVAPKDEIVITTPDPDEEARNDEALEKSKKTYANLSDSKRSKIKNAAGFHFAIENVEPMPPVDIDPATRYITLMTPDGNMIRMSKKLKDLVCCVSGEEQDAECVDQLKKWREKVAGSSLAYSSGNFGDILNLVKALQEESE